MSRFDAVAEVEKILGDAIRAKASDVHVEPGRERFELRRRVDGVVVSVGKYEVADGTMVVTRLMVLAKLLTYRLDVPQEGRLEFGGHALRLSTMPTAKGLRAAVRLPAELTAPRTLEDLGLGEQVRAGLDRFLGSSSGMLVVTGPAGSGKTTLLYALISRLRERDPGTTVVTLEDPVERELEGVTQIEVTPFGQMTYERALRSMLRQDPQVLMLGEVRDEATAKLAAQAALSGHRLLCTLHADSPAGAIRRLLDMGVEPGALASSVRAIVAVRLVRKLTGASDASGAAYAGRVPLAEYLEPDDELRRAIVAGHDLEKIKDLYESRPTHITLRTSGERLVAAGLTDQPELQRVLGGPMRVG